MSKRLCRLSALLICIVLCLSAVTPVFAATHITSSSQIDGFTYSAAIGNPAQALRKLLASSSAGNWSSYWASNGSVFQSKLTEMMSQYEQ